MAKPLNFGNLSLNDSEHGENSSQRPADSDARLLEMLAAQAAHQAGPELQDEETIANDDKLSESEKKEMLQKVLTMAASNGDVDKVNNIMNGNSRSLVDVNASDEDGTQPLIYASCFVSKLHLHTASSTYMTIGSRECRPSTDQSGCRCQPARPEPVECPHVGHDEPPQGHREASSGQQCVLGSEDIIWADCG